MNYFIYSRDVKLSVNTCDGKVVDERNHIRVPWQIQEGMKIQNLIYLCRQNGLNVRVREYEGAPGIGGQVI